MSKFLLSLKVVFFASILLFILGGVFGLDYVSPDVAERDYFLRLLPNQSYTISILAEDVGIPIEIQEVNCTAECKNLRKEGPYYFLDVLVGDEGKYTIELTYSKLGKIEKDTKRIDVSSSFVIVDSIVESERQYNQNSKIRFILQNNSDSDINLHLYSNLHDEILLPSNVLLLANSKKTEDLEFNSLYKGIYDIEFIAEYNDYKIEVGNAVIDSKFSLTNLLESNTKSYSVLLPQLSLFSSLRSIISWFG